MEGKTSAWVGAVHHKRSVLIVDGFIATGGIEQLEERLNDRLADGKIER